MDTLKSASQTQTLNTLPWYLSSKERPTKHPRYAFAIRIILRIRAIGFLLDDARIHTLSQRDFFKWLKIVRPLVEIALNHKNTSGITKKEFLALLERRSKTEKEGIAFFRSFGALCQGEIFVRPQYTLVSADSDPYFSRLKGTELNPLPEAAILCVKLFKQLYLSRPHYSEATLPNIQKAFSYICERKELCWENRNELCFAKASATMQHLISLGFQIENLFKIVIIGNNLGVEIENIRHHWTFHIAAGIQSENNLPCVFDPSLNPYSPICIKEWANRCRLDQSIPPTEAKILDRRTLPLKINPEDLILSEEGDAHTILVLPFCTSCFFPKEQGDPVKIAVTSIEDMIHFRLDLRDEFEKITFSKSNITMLSESLKTTPLFLQLLRKTFFFRKKTSSIIPSLLSSLSCEAN